MTDTTPSPDDMCALSVAPSTGTSTSTVPVPSTGTGTGTPLTGSPAPSEPLSAGRRWPSIGALLVVPLIGAVLSAIASRHGSVIGQDSAAYMGAAANLLHGRGLTTPFDVSGSMLSPARVFAFHGAVPLVHFPPLYPVALAAVASAGPSIAGGARWLNVVLMAANLLVFELLVRRFSRSAVLVPVAAAVLLLAGPAVFFHQDLLQIQTGVLSEPLFLFVFLLGILLVDRFLDRATRGLFLGIVACVALAPLIRYVGFGLVAGAAIVVLLWSPLARPRRWWAAVIISVCGLLPSAVWSLFVATVMHGGTVRSVAWHPPSQPIQGLLNIGSGWLFPGSVPEKVRWVLFVVVLAFVALALVRPLSRRSASATLDVRHVLAVVIFAVTYLLVVVSARMALDATTPLDNRILLPLIPLTYILVIAALVAITGASLPGKALVAGLCLIAAAPNISPALALMHQAPPSINATLAASPTMEAIRRLPPGTVIASGVEDLVYTYTGRSSIRVPVRVEGITDRPNARFDLQLRQLASILAEHHGVLVIVPAAQSDFVPTGATPSDLATVADVHLLRTLPDGGQLFGVTLPKSP